MKNEITTQQFDRTVSAFRRTSQEDMKVEFFDNAFWAYGSELATLRLAASRDKGRQGFSENLRTFYFMIECPGFTGEWSTN